MDEIIVPIGGLDSLTDTEQAAITERCDRFNMAIYRCRDGAPDLAANRAALLRFAARFGLRRLDRHLCVSEDGVSELSVAASGHRFEYVPYSSRGLGWHTDGYYNPAPRLVRAVVLHCMNEATTGGENALLDPEIVYIRLRDENPAFITALEHPECMTIPANTGADGSAEIRPAVSGPVFSLDPRGGAIHMRYSARKINVRWRNDPTTRAALEYLGELLAAPDGPVLHYRLQAGEGLISNNVLHNRTAFEDEPGCRRLIYRARYYDRIQSGPQGLVPDFA